LLLSFRIHSICPQRNPGGCRCSYKYVCLTEEQKNGVCDLNCKLI